jgi:hypothetical protein
MRLFIGLSVAFNVALAAAYFLPTKKAPAAHSSPPPPIAAAPAQPPSPVNDSTNSEAAFRWDQVASPDLKIYRDNLRAIGCPELTLHEIMRAVINELFRLRRQAILASFQDHYWDLVLHRQLIRRQWIPRSEWGQALTALADKREKLLGEVLGPETSPSPDSRQTPRADLEQRLAWLSPEKREALIELEEKHQQRLAEWTKSLGSRVNGPRTAEDDAALRQVETEFDTAESQLLTPEELAEVRLSESNVAGWAASLPGFNPTEDQWQSLTELRAQYENSKAALDNTAPGFEDQARQLQDSFNDAVKGVLDPNGYAQYQLANNGQYQALQSVTQRYGLPDSVTAQSLDVQQAAQAQADQIRGDPNMSPEVQQAALNAIQEQTEQTLGQILGPDVLGTYKEYGGDWITGLSHGNQK